MKKCQDCGAEMELDALFCRECGTRFSDDKVDYINAELSRIIDLHWKYAHQNVSGIHTLLSPQHYPNIALQLISWKENGQLVLGLNFGLESSNQEEKELLDKFRKSSFMPLVKPDEGCDLYTGDLYGIIEFINIEEAKRILSSLFYDVFNQKENDTLDYLIETDKERYACSAGYNTKGASCMSVLAIFICVVVLIMIII